jgi:hypothetical protein
VVVPGVIVKEICGAAAEKRFVVPVKLASIV